jgi:hypothetical protein
MDNQAQVQAQARKFTKGLFIFFGAIGAFFVAIFIFAAFAPETKISDLKGEELEQRLREECRTAVVYSAHDPGSAEMDNSKYYSTTEKTTHFSIFVTGRLKNGFGALRKTTAECLITRDGRVLSVKQL